MTFQWPYLLLTLAIVPILAALYVLAQRRRRDYAVRFTNLALLSQVVTHGPGLRRHLPPLLYLLGIPVLLISVARPTAVIAVPRDQTTVILVLDVSGSMTARDLEPNRMAAAKSAARTFVSNLSDDVRIGLVSFSTAAQVNSTPTRDRAAVTRAIDSLFANGGTAIGEGLNLALDQLAASRETATRPGDDPGPPGIVVLLSDGQSNNGRPPAVAAARAKADGVKVYTVGIGDRSATPLVDGRIPARLDEPTLRNIATETGGEYFYAAESKDLESVYQGLSAQMGWVEERTEITALVTALGTTLVLIAGILGLRWSQQLP